MRYAPTFLSDTHTNRHKQAHTHTQLIYTIKLPFKQKVAPDGIDEVFPNTLNDIIHWGGVSYIHLHIFNQMLQFSRSSFGAK